MTSQASTTQAALEPFFPAGALCEEKHLVHLRMLAKRIRMASLPQLQGMLAGTHLSKQKGRGLDLDELRIYQPGDDIRTIDWRVTARTQLPHTRLYKEERERPVMILCDQRSPMFFGSKRCFKSVTAAQCFSLIAWAAIEHGDKVGAFLLGDNGEIDFRPKQRAQHVLHILQHLIQFNRQLANSDHNIQRSLSESLQHIKRSLKPGTTLFLISDFYDLNEADKEVLFQLKRHNHVVALQVFDPLEREVPPTGTYGVNDGVQESVLNIQGNNRKQYKEALDIWQQGLNSLFQKLSVSHHLVSAGDIPYSAIKLALEQKGRV
ncbi:DUF58 domain-containing protein [Bermanella marisrubri]|uniref:Uncharacterized conserved protein (Some members contain a von Willebrand factor type A (VWA) domain) n=1 Tax=Bermanella marisrubri TaxID=207949 RepID=Q1N644_9GAMM|nr:DUF58 domain-containing protein [Bermanella marisrubri]EAT13748.1 uncharacterized conserved protein (some members contain a von Willebrand factor type A (vWA) domain) [Oceanobacter sp. RED65] [Bermanella marisrubri]QIZ84522.1 DUF58 domain-containing protein [Bermanella marisrubri]